jgi:hypothetical protein
MTSAMPAIVLKLYAGAARLDAHGCLRPLVPGGQPPVRVPRSATTAPRLPARLLGVSSPVNVLVTTVAQMPGSVESARRNPRHKIRSSES